MMNFGESRCEIKIKLSLWKNKLRKFFEVDKEHLVAYSLSVLAKEQLITSKYAKEAIKKYNIDGERPMPTKL